MTAEPRAGLRMAPTEPEPQTRLQQAARFMPRHRIRSMSNPIINSLTVVAIGAACAACTNRGVYEATESLRLEDCRDIVTHEEREACEDKARMSYAEYEALRERETGTE